MKLRHIITLSLLVLSQAHANTCVITGFFDENCAAVDDCRVSTIFWKSEFDCYAQYGYCEANNEGLCGWRQSPELQQCLAFKAEQVLAADPFPD